MTETILQLAEAAEFAMLLEVSAKVKPGNIDRMHDYPDTLFEHFLCSSVRARAVFERIDELTIGEAMYEAVKTTNTHSGGNTHFGAFILLLPLLKGRGVEGARTAVRQTTVEDAVLFYRAFGLTAVRVARDSDLDVNDPASLDTLREKGMTMYDVMSFSAENDMVAREWVNGFALTREAANRLLQLKGGAASIPQMFLSMLSEFPDTFVAKKFGWTKAEELCTLAKQVKAGSMSLEELDNLCLKEGMNPGSLADICIAGIFTALLEGWEWDC